MFCWSCGREITDCERYCEFCGASVGDAYVSNTSAGNGTGENCVVRNVSSHVETKKVSLQHRFIVALLAGYLSFNIIVQAVFQMSKFLMVLSDQASIMLSNLSVNTGIVLLIGIVLIYSSCKLSVEAASKRLQWAALVIGALLAVLSAATLFQIKGQGYYGYEWSWSYYVWIGIGISIGIACAAAVGLSTGKKSIVFYFALDVIAAILVTAVLYILLAMVHLGSVAASALVYFAEMFLIMLPLVGFCKGRRMTEPEGMNIETQEKEYDIELLFRYMVSAFMGLAVNVSVICIDLLLVVVCFEKYFYRFFTVSDYIYSLSGITYMFIYLVSFMVLSYGIFLLRKELGDKRIRWVIMVLGIILAVLQVGECVILLAHSWILGAVFLVGLVVSLLLGFYVHSVKIGMHMVYYVAALLMNVGCTIFIGVCCMKGRMPYLYFPDSVAVIVPLTVLLPLISFVRARCCSARSGRNADSEVKQSGSVYQTNHSSVREFVSGNPSDASSFGYVMLGFFVPVAGLTLYLVWHGTLPLRAKSAGKGALAAVIFNIVLVAIYAVVVVMLL